MNTEYIKNYKYKELKQFILAYLLIAIASVGFQTQVDVGTANLLSSLMKMATVDVLVGAMCPLVFVFNELWPDKAKTKIVYRQLPSNNVFGDIATGNVDATGFDLEKARNKYAPLFSAPATKQTAVWNGLLIKSRTVEHGNVIEAERLQLMTRDICVSTISLLIMTIIVLAVMMIFSDNLFTPLKILGLPIIYLIVMFFITRGAAMNRAKRLVLLVIKNDVQCD